jgi:8-oxo-dGTP pyrophosphatase MutT (NUDIX family)
MAPRHIFLQNFIHTVFRLKRPLTLGARAVIHQPKTGAVLLVRHRYSRGWELPGGGVEVGESALEALLREVVEETGVQCISPRILGVYHNRSVSERDHVALYMVEDWSELELFAGPSLEIAEVDWFKLDALPSDTTRCARYGCKLVQQDIPG